MVQYGASKGVKFMSDNDNALDSLFIDKEPVDTTALAETLRPSVRLHSSTGEVFFTDQWASLSNRNKVLLYSLARKALAIKGVIPDEKASPSQFAAETHLPGGSVRPQLSQLVKDRIMNVDKESNYWIPDHNLTRVRRMIEDKEN